MGPFASVDERFRKVVLAPATWVQHGTTEVLESQVVYNILEIIHLTSSGDIHRIFQTELAYFIGLFRHLVPQPMGW